MANPTISPPNVQLVDPRTGYPTADGYRFLALLCRQSNGNAGAEIVTVDAAQDVYPNSRRLRVESGALTLSDADPDVTLGLPASGVVAGAYGGATMTVSFTVDAKGRMTSAAAVALNSTNITEGTKLFFTDARARAAFSGSTNIAISGGGVISTVGDDAALTSGPIVDLVAVDGVIQSVDQIVGFTGTGAYTNFTIDRGVITAAS